MSVLKQVRDSSNPTLSMVLLSGIGLVFFFAITFTFSFQNKVFKAFFPKQASLASELNLLPKADLKSSVDATVRNGVINASAQQESVVLKWTTEGKATSCYGRSFGLTDQDKSWDGPKDVNGGSFTTKKLNQANPYIYSIDCTNENGDALGSTLTVNAGVRSQTKLRPYIDSFKVTDSQGKSQKIDTPIIVKKGEMITITWTSLNTTTPYSICFASGSWPTGYLNISNQRISEQFTLSDSKIYSYNLYCSNEFGYAYQAVNIAAE